MHIILPLSSKDAYVHTSTSECTDLRSARKFEFMLVISLPLGYHGLGAASFPSSAKKERRRKKEPTHSAFVELVITTSCPVFSHIMITPGTLVAKSDSLLHPLRLLNCSHYYILPCVCTSHYYILQRVCTITVLTSYPVFSQVIITSYSMFAQSQSYILPCVCTVTFTPTSCVHKKSLLHSSPSFAQVIINVSSITIFCLGCYCFLLFVITTSHFYIQFCVCSSAVIMTLHPVFAQVIITSYTMFAQLHVITFPEGRLGMSDVSLLSGISGLSFDSTLLSPLLFFCLFLLTFLSYPFLPAGPFF